MASLQPQSFCEEALLIADNEVERVVPNALIVPAIGLRTSRST